MATTYTIPTSGLFKAVGDNGDAVYSFDANGVPTHYSIVDPNAGVTNNYGANQTYLQSYGIDWNSLPTFNRADIDQRLTQLGQVNPSNGMPIYNAGGGLTDLANLKGVPVTTTGYTVNQNLPANAVNPNAVGANGQFVPAPGATPSNNIPTNAQYPAQIANLGTPLAPPTTSGSPTLPNGTAPNIADQFNTSLASTLQAQQSQLQQALQQQTQNYQTQIDALKQQQQHALDQQSLGLQSEQSTVAAETAAKQAALDQEQQQFQQNYQARQQLTDQLSTLLTTGQQVIEQMKATTGLSSIMSPRISQTMADVQGQAGVITATLAAYSDQIGLAQNQLQSATSAISSIYGDQITYWQNVVSFYDNQSKTDLTQIASLTKDQKTYIDAQIQQLQDNITNTQNTANAIQKAMLDPTTALTYAKAGVSLTDTPAQIAQKIATYEQAQQNVWSAPTLLGGDYISTNKLTGETRTVVSNVASGSSSAASGSSPNYSKGTMSAKQFVELSLQRAGLLYQDALDKVPSGKVGVIDNATGQIGFIDPTEYNTKQYTYL